MDSKNLVDPKEIERFNKKIYMRKYREDIKIKELNKKNNIIK
tara:strand:- start:86 stop:211 length:126 start_codon:yes stop_codon:yes gene_type:complete